MKKTVVINVVGLTERLIKHMPFLSTWSGSRITKNIQPVLPAVTCSAQSSYLTGKWPKDHGIVGNGWYFKEEAEVKFWRQPNKLVQAEKIWDVLRREDREFTCANLFWWYNMYSTVDYSVTPRPMYPSDGRKIPDVYAHPEDLRQELQREFGTFPLFEFWGPATTVKCSQWIAKASKFVDKKHDPTLTFIYIPHLDYNLQRLGPEDSKVTKDFEEVDAVCEDLISYYESIGAEVLVLSEYGITAVQRPVYINQELRRKGFIAVREELGLEVFDAGASAAFAVCDHQIAHIYLNDKDKLEEVRQIIANMQGVEQVLTKNEGEDIYNICHERAGDLIAVTDKDSWFCYYYWLDDRKAPDYARTVDIHRKPGYDPVELFVNPKIKFPKAKIGAKLIKKKLGFRTLMDVIPLEPELVKGSHGRIPESKEDWPVMISTSFQNEDREIQAPDVFHEIKRMVLSS